MQLLMLSSGKCEIGNIFISQHDNYVKHTANAVKQFQMSLKDPGELPEDCIKKLQESLLKRVQTELKDNCGCIRYWLSCMSKLS